MLSSQSDDPANFYFLASWLNRYHQDPPAPEVCRVIIGRAYYAAFLAARDLGQRKGTGVTIHSDVIKYYRVSDAYISNKLSDLKCLREQADYELTRKITTSDVATSLKGCREILKRLEVLDCSEFYPESYEPLNIGAGK